MKHYLVYFAAVYSFALLLLGILFSLLNLNTSISIPTLIAAGFITAGHFVKREQRRPSDDERIQLIWSCTITSLIITSLVLFFYSLLSPAASNILNVVKSTNIILIAIMMLLILVHAVVFFVSFGWYANRCAQKLNV
ncbi:MAG: ABZJ_00895 family protein [Acinetobacter harbinensis]|uniref:ABZJ_00895 family protein n=1 Tax=Acinetobacter harbinensis TaxID=1353941 RepID=UPI0028E30B7C|nr:ABZJ_00895 family protein [Acinetobacter harbinensis]MDD2939623.1 ABZJ_00895 family protein [Acinetobacter harbinensis]